jgi:hypothetical protein
MVEASTGALSQEVNPQAVPEWQTFTPNPGRAGGSTSRGLRYVLESPNAKKINIGVIQSLFNRFDEKKLNDESQDLNGDWLNRYREVRYLTTRMWCVENDPNFTPYESVEEANQAVARVAELLQPYLKPEEAK